MPYISREIQRNAILLIARLERLSADSSYAHKASGVRRSLMQSINSLDAEMDLKKLKKLIEHGYQILHSAAKEIPSDLDI